MVRSVVRGLFLAAALTALGGCAATVGDPCTTGSDCGSGLCLNRGFTPGGYCSQQCELSDANSCPSGTVCVLNAVGENVSGCFRACDRDDTCRAGYTCRSSEDWPGRICIGPGKI